MDTKYYFFIAIGILIIVFIIYRIATRNKRLRAKLLGRIRSSFGTVPKREYTEEELDKIKTYYETVKDTGKDSFCIDDITWNDLNMDTLFITMNHTYSSQGEEVLYDLLREPCFDKEEAGERERVITFFERNPDIRENLQIDFACIGRTKKFSTVQVLSEFRKLDERGYIAHITPLVLIAISIITLILKPGLGILFGIVSIGYNLYTYYKHKGEIEAYYVSATAIAYLIKGGLLVASENAPEIMSYTEKMKNEIQPVKAVTKHLKWLGSNGFVGGSADFFQILMDYVRLLTHIDFLKFYKIVKLIKNNENHIYRLIYTMGYLEAMISIASYRKTLPFYCTPEFTEDGMHMHLKDAYHPLLKEPVANSLDSDKCILLTGSNASGKSTFLRTVAIDALMAQTIHTVYAHEYRAGFFRVFSSMALKDDIMSNDSYYLVEIKSLKRIMDALPGRHPVMCFVDEVLRGTNTVERIAASSQVLKELSDEKAFVFAATHDIELTNILEDYYDNYNFTEETKDDEIYFTYRLYKGRATSRNAIKLLGIMGYNKSVVENAEKRAEDFVREGVWKNL